MSALLALSGTASVQLFGHTIVLGPGGLAAIGGWILFAIGALFAIRERMQPAATSVIPPMVRASLSLAAISAGLGLLLSESYPTVSRQFCLPYAVLAVAATVVGWAAHSATRQTEGE